jgi:hypothetical protein
MRILARYAFCVSTVSTLLAGCGGWLAPIGVPFGRPQSPVATIATQTGRANGVYQVLHRFPRVPLDAASPKGLTSLDGLLYGTSGAGGPNSERYSEDRS